MPKAAGRPYRLAILLSGRGSNMVAIAEAISNGTLPNVEIAVVIANVEGAGGISRAQQLGIATRVIPSKGRKREEHDREMLAALAEYGPDLVCLAGYMRLLSPAFVQAYAGQLINIHPSLLPAFPGLDAQGQAWEYGVAFAGCTVHFVDEQLDHGVIILQKAVAVEAADSVETLSARILTQEHLAYPEAISMVLSGEYKIAGRRYVRTGASGVQSSEQ